MATIDTNDTYKPLTGVIYLFNMIVGTGALTMPAAFANAGWLASLVIVIVLCFVSYITATFVIESMSSANAVLKQRRYKSRKEYTIDSDEAVLEENCFFDITQKVEMATMADLFLTRVGVKLFYLAIIVYLFGDLAIYATGISKSLRDVSCTFKHEVNQTIQLSDPCWTGVQSISRANAYRLYLCLVLVFVTPFAFFNLQKTKYLQIFTTLLRWTAFLSMIILAIIAITSGKANAKPKVFSVKGIPNLFGVCVYSFMCHHSLPSVVTPISDKRLLFRYILFDYILILSFYSLLSFTGIFAFDHLQDIYTLNFQADNDGPISPVPVLDYLLPLYPVFTLSTNFPIISITLQNNLKNLFTSTHSQKNSSFFTRRLLYPLVSIIPSFCISFATEDLEILVGVVGSYAGACIQYVFPALFVYYSRRRLATLYPKLLSNTPWLKSPFGHNIWILLVLIWSVISLAFVTTDHIIEFTK